MSCPRTNKSNGLATLTVVIIVTLVMSAIIVTIQAITLFTIKLSRTNIAEKEAFYTTESILYDSLARIDASFNDVTREYDWTASTLAGSPLRYGNIEVEREITTNNVSGQFQYTVSVTGTGNQAARRLVATIELDDGTVPDNDVMIVTDLSGSMEFVGNHTCDGWNTVLAPEVPFPACAGEPEYIAQPLYASKSSADYFVDLVQDGGPIEAATQIGVVGFSNWGVLKKELDSDHTRTRQVISGLGIEGGTNIEDGLFTAMNELWYGANARSNARKIIILLTDGLPTRTGQQTATWFNCWGNPGTPPRHNIYQIHSAEIVEHDCSQGAVDTAFAAKNPAGVEPPITIYGIGLGLFEPHGSWMGAEEIFFGHLLLDEIVNSPAAQYAYYMPQWENTDSTIELQQIYATILQHILSRPQLNIAEQPAD